MNATVRLAVVALAIGTAAPAAAPAQQDFRWSGRISQGDEVRIQAIEGAVRAELASGNEVVVTARTRGPNADEVRVEAHETAEGVTICVVYPGSRGTGHCGGGGGSRDGNWNRRQHASVDFVVRVPAGVKLEVGLVNGDIDAIGLRGPVSVATVSGDIRVATTGTVTASSVSGDIDATIGSLGRGGSSFNAVSGDVTLRLASGLGAEVRVNTLSGSIRSDYDLERPSRSRGGWNIEIGSSARGTIGGGGPSLNVQTVSGDVAVRRAR